MNEHDDWKPPIDIDSKDILILVIDDDHTSLSVIAGILRTWKYNVETVRSGGEALSILRSKQDKKFDLVVTDIHMPDMNGFELLRSIWTDFQVPIVMMSSDDSEKIMTKGLECGASYFMRKPVCPKDLQNLWLYVIPKRNQESVTRQNIVIADTNNNTHKNHGNSTVQKVPGSSVPSAKIMSKGTYQSREALVEKHQEENTRRRKISTLKLNQKLKVTATDSVPPLNYPISVFANRKPKVAWFTGLHNKFLDALKIIGLDRAVPKKILEVMNVPGLTRENVASHLQKYRIFLKRIADVAEKGDGMSKPSKSKFASSYLPMPFGFDLDDADENLLRKKLKQELRAIRDPSWRQYGNVSLKNNVASNYSVPMSLGGTSGDITNAGNCQMISGQQTPAFVPYEMNMNSNMDVSGFQGDFSDRIMNSSVCSWAELQNKNQESETITRQTDCSYFGEDFNPWFDQEPIQTQAGNQNANMLITDDELLAMCQGFRGDAGNSSRMGSPTKRDDAV